VTGRCNIAVQADADLAGLDGGSFDLLMIPGGPGIKGLRADGRAAALAAKYALAGKPIGAICAAPLVLWDAGLLTDKKFTAHSSTHGELPQALALEPVVMDGGIITARGAGTAMDFGFALVARLFGEPAAREIAKAIMV
jgi:4-methyl-5(b-hydroxyethyl)-thiazole monophosphate biosynthesis